MGADNFRSGCCPQYSGVQERWSCALPHNMWTLNSRFQVPEIAQRAARALRVSPQSRTSGQLTIRRQRDGEFTFAARSYVRGGTGKWRTSFRKCLLPHRVNSLGGLESLPRGEARPLHLAPAWRARGTHCGRDMRAEIRKHAGLSTRRPAGERWLQSAAVASEGLIGRCAPCRFRLAMIASAASFSGS